jgi:hypothetical protein
MIVEGGPPLDADGQPPIALIRSRLSIGCLAFPN